MSTAEELLASAFASDVLKVDFANRTITIPNSVKHLGVTSDEDVMKVLFEAPQFYGDIDLSGFEINIHYKNAKGYGDISPAIDIVVEAGVITFAWLIDRYVVAYAGDVEFSVCLTRPDASESDGLGQELNTQPATLPVLKGLNTRESVPEEFPHLYRDLLERVKELEYKASDGDSSGAQEYKLSGRWALSDPVNLSGADFDRVTLNGNVKTKSAFDLPIYGITAIEGVGVSYSLSSSEAVGVTDVEGGFLNYEYRYLDFGEEGISVTKEFYEWFTGTAFDGAYTSPAIPKKYNVTLNLTNFINFDSPPSKVVEGDSYTFCLIPSPGYRCTQMDIFYILDGDDYVAIDTINRERLTVLMGGVDITDKSILAFNVVTGCFVVSIDSVTGDIVITASAVAE